MGFVSLTKTQTSGDLDPDERYLFVRPEHVVTIECEQGTTRLLLSTGDVRFIRETMAEAYGKLDPESYPYRAATAGDSELERLK